MVIFSIPWPQGKLGMKSSRIFDQQRYRSDGARIGTIRITTLHFRPGYQLKDARQKAKGEGNAQMKSGVSLQASASGIVHGFPRDCSREEYSEGASCDTHTGAGGKA